MVAHPMLEHDAASAWLGLEVLELSEGFARARALIRPEMLNGFGTAHGGMLFSIADTVFALACNDPEDTSTNTVAQGVDINFLAPAFAGEYVTATGRRVASTGRSGVYDVVLTQPHQGQERTVAIFRGRSRTIPRR